MPTNGEPVGVEGLPLGPFAGAAVPPAPAPATAAALDDPATALVIRRSRTKAHRWLMLGILLVVVFGVAANVVQSNAEELYQNGVEVEGTVAAVDPEDSIVVLFLVNGRVRRGVVHLDDGSPDYAVGEAVLIYYDPANPSRFRTEADVNQSPSTVMPMIFALIGGITCVIVGLLAIRRARRYRRVLRAHRWRALPFEYVTIGRGRGVTQLVALGSPQGEYIGVYQISNFGVRAANALQKSSGGTVWVAGDPKRRLILALPGPIRLTEGRPPRSARARRRWEEAAGVGGSAPAT